MSPKTNGLKKHCLKFNCGHTADIKMLFPWPKRKKTNDIFIVACLSNYMLRDVMRPNKPCLFLLSLI